MGINPTKDHLRGFFVTPFSNMFKARCFDELIKSIDLFSMGFKQTWYDIENSEINKTYNF